MCLRNKQYARTWPSSQGYNQAIDRTFGASNGIMINDETRLSMLSASSLAVEVLIEHSDTFQ